MIVCSSCGSAMEDDLRFCTECGTPARQAETIHSQTTRANQPAPALGQEFRATETWQLPTQPSGYAAQSSQPASVTHSPALMFGVIAVVALLALLVGGAAVWLLKSPAGSVGSNAPTINASTQPSPPGETSFNTQTDRRAESPGSYESVESKIINGQSIDTRDLFGRSSVELQRLRNAVFARHGRIFETAELQRYFDSCAWYVRRSDYTDQSLTSIDKENVKVIIAAEK
jgi:YARHG domain